MSGERVPPALPGEVWRDKDRDGDHVAVTVDAEGTARAWYIDICGEWGTCHGADIYRAWALHERAVAAAERERADAWEGFHRARDERDYMQSAWDNARTTASAASKEPGLEEAKRAYAVAEARLRALGVEP